MQILKMALKIKLKLVFKWFLGAFKVYSKQY